MALFPTSLQEEKTLLDQQWHQIVQDAAIMTAGGQSKEMADHIPAAHRKQRASRMQGQAVNPQNPSPVMYFLQQVSISYGSCNLPKQHHQLRTTCSNTWVYRGRFSCKPQHIKWSNEACFVEKSKRRTHCEIIRAFSHINLRYMCKQPMSKVKERVWERGSQRETNPSERQRQEWRRMRGAGVERKRARE